MTFDDLPTGGGPTLKLEPEETLRELPETPEGWRSVCTLHLHVGRGVGVGVYEVLDPQGRAYPVSFCFRGPRRSAGGRPPPGAFEGYFLDGSVVDAAHAMTWPQLRAAWPRWRTAHLHPTSKG